MIDTGPAIRAGLLECPFHLKRLGQWGKAHKRKAASTTRYRYELSEMRERFQQYAAACAYIAAECFREADDLADDAARHEPPIEGEIIS